MQNLSKIFRGVFEFYLPNTDICILYMYKIVRFLSDVWSQPMCVSMIELMNWVKNSSWVYLLAHLVFTKYSSTLSLKLKSFKPLSKNSDIFLKELFKLFELLSYITNWLFKIKEIKNYYFFKKNRFKKIKKKKKILKPQ